MFSANELPPVITQNSTISGLCKLLTWPFWADHRQSAGIGSVLRLTLYLLSLILGDWTVNSLSQYALLWNMTKIPNITHKTHSWKQFKTRISPTLIKPLSLPSPVYSLLYESIVQASDFVNCWLGLSEQTIINLLGMAHLLYSRHNNFVCH